MFGLMLTFILLFGINPTPLQAPQKQAPSADATQELRTLDQALLDAVAPGDTKLWGSVLAPDYICVDESGVITDRKESLDQLKPLPPGVSGNIKISAYSARFIGDVATVVHTDEEEEFYHGQTVHARYLTSETWLRQKNGQRQNGEWKLLMSHVYSILHEPPAVTLTPAELDAYVGHYTASSSLSFTIKREGDHLVGERESGPAVTLNTELRDVFFVSGKLRTRKIFSRDDSGKVTGFVDRREGNDLVWKRVEK